MLHCSCAEAVSDRLKPWIRGDDMALRSHLIVRGVAVVAWSQCVTPLCSLGSFEWSITTATARGLTERYAVGERLLVDSPIAGKMGGGVRRGVGGNGARGRKYRLGRVNGGPTPPCCGLRAEDALHRIGNPHPACHEKTGSAMGSVPCRPKPGRPDMIIAVAGNCTELPSRSPRPWVCA